MDEYDPPNQNEMFSAITYIKSNIKKEQAFKNNEKSLKKRKSNLKVLVDDKLDQSRMLGHVSFNWVCNKCKKDYSELDEHLTSSLKSDDHDNKEEDQMDSSELKLLDLESNSNGIMENFDRSKTIQNILGSKLQ